jgi:N-acetylated-alpha-linked acidic dipeptidase
VFGGVDPSSGTASMMEMARAFAELRRSGWRPRRTLVLCSWDGEEVGLTGSTEWGEQFAEDLRAKAVAYLNVDSSASGPDPSFSAVASLAPLLVEVSRDLAAPTGSSLYQAWRDSTDRRRRARGEPPAGEADLVDTRIGSGSDHTVFLNHLGRPTVGLSFEGPYGVYHSVYDSFRWMERYGDPGHRYQVLMAQYWGSLALRLANAEVLPLDVSFYAATVRGFVAELEASPAARVHPDLSSLKASLHALERSGARLRDAVDAALATGGLRAPAAARLNAGLLRFEGNWLDPEGIPGRPWFKHLLYAARYTYAHLELPGLTEAVEEGDAARAADQARRLEAAVKTNTALVDDLVALAAAGGS